MIVLLILAFSLYGEPIRIEMYPRTQSACEQYRDHFVGEIERRGGTVQRAECR